MRESVEVRAFYLISLRHLKLSVELAGAVDCIYTTQWDITRLGQRLRTPSVLVKEIVLDKIWVKYWEYKSSITFKLLSL